MPKTPFDRLLDSAEWKKLPCKANAGDGDLPYTTHEGTLTIMGCTLRVYQLSDGQRVIAEEDLIAFFGGAQPLDEIEKEMGIGSPATE